MKRIVQFLSPDTRPVSVQERMLSAFLAFIATLLCFQISSFFIDIAKEPVYIASLGAAAVLLFAAPHSPFSQPWAMIGSHVVSASIGVLCLQLIPYQPLTVAVAVGLAIFFMYMLRCLHPPGGAAALAVILGSPEVQQMGYQYVLSPVLVNVLVLLGIALIVNNLVPGRSYPNQNLKRSESQEKKLGVQTTLYNQDDLEKALGEMGTYIDISRADLQRIYRLAVSHANQRRMGNVKCRDIMKTDVLTFEFSTELELAWKKLHERSLKGAVVIDSFRRVIGVVTIRDFVHYADIHNHQEVRGKIKKFLQRTEGQSSSKLEVVGQIMTAPAICVDQDQHVIHLIDVFADNHFHHLPIIDKKKYLVGIITRSDLMRALAVLRN
ncbi:MAG TPA: CBS domain-containing protein [Gammaproteobacteria bacterium]|nr:CBS domain-containing protein [Gammaproteobacteria bacterium]